MPSCAPLLSLLLASRSVKLWGNMHSSYALGPRTVPRRNTELNGGTWILKRQSNNVPRGTQVPLTASAKPVYSVTIL